MNWRERKKVFCFFCWECLNMKIMVLLNSLLESESKFGCRGDAKILSPCVMGSNLCYTEANRWKVFVNSLSFVARRKWQQTPFSMLPQPPSSRLFNVKFRASSLLQCIEVSKFLRREKLLQKTVLQSSQN